MAKHTEGEWRIKPAMTKKGNVRYLISGDNWALFAKVYTINGSADHTEALANAKLIAAAPDMLNALLQVKEWLEIEDIKRNGTHIRLIEAAIKKATE